MTPGSGPGSWGSNPCPAASEPFHQEGGTMAAITESVEIARRPEDVFAYLDDLARHGEWQEQIVSVTSVTDGPTRVGSRATEVRRAGGREFTGTYEITE